jgi:hypothetical protein
MISNPAKGKVHILWNSLDEALSKSPLVNEGVQRIGATGVNDDLIDDACKGFVVHKNVQESPLPPNSKEHNYEFDDFAIKYYEDQHF